MPRGNQQLINPYHRVLLYGAGKMKKTWWALNAAEAGYNVLLIDANRGGGIKEQLNPEAQERVFIVESADSEFAPNAFSFLHAFCGNLCISYNERTRQVSQFPQDGFIQFDLRKHNPNLVFVVDSWTDICRSIDFEFARKNGINLADAEKNDWEGYGWAGRVASWMLAQLKSLPCHLILIGHEHVYERYRGQGRDRKLIETRTQPYSVSGPHGKRVGVEFNDVLRFYRSGITNWIDADGNTDKDAGSRALQPRQYNWNELQFATIAGRAVDDTVIRWEDAEIFPATAAPTIKSNVVSAPPRITIPGS